MHSYFNLMDNELTVLFPFTFWYYDQKHNNNLIRDWGVKFVFTL